MADVSGNFQHPGIIDRITDLSETVLNDENTVGATVIESGRGPIFKAINNTNTTQFSNIWGKRSLKYKFGMYSAIAALNDLGSLYVVRAVSSDSKYGAIKVPTETKGEIVQTEGYTQADLKGDLFPEKENDALLILRTENPNEVDMLVSLKETTNVPFLNETLNASVNSLVTEDVGVGDGFTRTFSKSLANSVDVNNLNMRVYLDGKEIAKNEGGNLVGSFLTGIISSNNVEMTFGNEINETIATSDGEKFSYIYNLGVNPNLHSVIIKAGDENLATVSETGDLVSGKPGVSGTLINNTLNLSLGEQVVDQLGVSDGLIYVYNKTLTAEPKLNTVRIYKDRNVIGTVNEEGKIISDYGFGEISGTSFSMTFGNKITEEATIGTSENTYTGSLEVLAHNETLVVKVGDTVVGSCDLQGNITGEGIVSGTVNGLNYNFVLSSAPSETVTLEYVSFENVPELNSALSIIYVKAASTIPASGTNITIDYIPYNEIPVSGSNIFLKYANSNDPEILVKCLEDHGLKVGDKINTESATDLAYSGIFNVVSVPDSTTFVYAIKDFPTEIRITDLGFGKMPDLEDRVFDITVKEKIDGVYQEVITFWNCSLFEKVDAFGVSMYLPNKLNNSTYYLGCEINEALALKEFPKEFENVKITGGSLGSPVTNTELKKAWDLFKDTALLSDISLLINGGYVGENDIEIQDKIREVADSRRDCLYLLDVPYSQTAITPEAKVVEWRKKVQKIDSYRGALYTPWISCRDSENKTIVPVPPSGWIAQIIARRDAVEGKASAPAGYEYGVLRSTILTPITVTERYVEDQDLDKIYLANINYILDEWGVGCVVSSQKTMQSKTSALSAVNVVKLVLHLVKVMKRAQKSNLFKLNTPALRVRIETSLNKFLAPYISNGSLQDTSKVVCDDTNNTAADQDNEQLNIDAFLCPTRVASKIIVSGIITSSGANVSVTEV